MTELSREPGSAPRSTPRGPTYEAPASAPAGSVATVAAPPPPTPKPKARPAPAPPRGPRRARLAVKKVDPWSVLKFTFVYSLALVIVVVVAVGILYLVLDTMGVFDSIDTTLQQFTSSSDAPKRLTDVLSFGRVVGGAAVLGAVNVVLLTALATLGAWIYNLCSDLVGGIEVTLTERN